MHHLYLLQALHVMQFQLQVSDAVSIAVLQKSKSSFISSEYFEVLPLSLLI